MSVTEVLKKQASSMWAAIPTSGKIGLAIAAISVVVSVIDAITDSADELKEKLSKLADEYQELKSQEESLNEELKTTKERIVELQTLAANGTITVVEQAELQTLRQENAELERQIELNKIRQRETTKTAQKTFKGLVREEDLHDRKIERYLGSQFQRYLALQEQIANESDPSQSKKLQSQADAILKVFVNKEKALQDALDDLFDSGYVYGLDEETDKYRRRKGS